MLITRNTAGDSAAAVSSTAQPGTFAVQVQSKDPVDGSVDSATVYFTRAELEAFREQITAALMHGAPEPATIPVFPTI
jgi:hypothetical protein